MIIDKLHHIAIICSDYKKSKNFYTNVLGLEILAETYREERQSHKLDLGLNGAYVIELFSFPNPPARPSRPEAVGLRHIAFAVQDIESSLRRLQEHDIEVEPIRLDAITGKKFTFFQDPDALPIEFYEL